MTAAGIYIVLNIFSFALFAFDKRKAKNNSWRTSENTLLLSSLFGPFGAVTAMRTFRHKTQKTKFLLCYVFCALHLVIFGMILAGKI